jgi:hypothetical protein
MEIWKTYNTLAEIAEQQGDFAAVLHYHHQERVSFAAAPACQQGSASSGLRHVIDTTYPTSSSVETSGCRLMKLSIGRSNKFTNNPRRDVTHCALFFP